jgi:hypothetical protein
MAIKIIGTSSGVEVDSRSASKALFVEQFDSGGRACFPAESYSAIIDIAPATTLTDGTTYWSMRNNGGGGRVALIRQIELIMLFTGTAAASVSSYRFERFNTATPTGGSSITANKFKNSYANTTMTDIRFLNTGLTTTSVVFEATGFIRTGHMNQLTANVVQDFKWHVSETVKQELAAGEGLCIRANGALVAGTRMIGQITWDER